MIEIDKKLLKWVLSHDESDQVYARSYGSFSISRMDLSVQLSKEEIEKFNEAEQFFIKNDGIDPSMDIIKDYYLFIQAHNHELFHYYQALTLPAFQIYQRLTKTKLKYEASTMLRFFDEGNSFILGKDHSVLAPLKQSNFYNSSEIAENFNEFILKYKFYVQQWHSEYKGVSLFHLIEGMAHIFSVQLTDSAINYLPELEEKDEYHIAYNIFNSYIGKQYDSLDIRIKHLMFLYICHFSCQIYDDIEDSILEKPSRLFHTLCSRLNLYIESFYELLTRYEKYTDIELRELNQFNINDQNLKLANKAQISHVYAFFELIPCIEQDAKKYYMGKTVTQIPKKYLKIFNDLNIDLNSSFQLAKFSMFPSVWADLWEAYDSIQDLQVDKQDFKLSEEIAFYEFIENCKMLLNKKVSSVLCCEEHGFIKNKASVLYCKNSDGLAYYLKGLTNREAFDLIKDEGEY